MYLFAIIKQHNRNQATGWIPTPYHNTPDQSNITTRILEPIAQTPDTWPDAEDIEQTR